MEGVMQGEDEVRALVRERYGAIAREKGSCCAPSCCGPEMAPDGLNVIGDAYEGVEGRLAEADLNLGCGVPTQHAALRRGETVLDLGSGAGTDVIISNCVLNLLPDKAPAFVEMFRALRPGGRFCVSDIVATGQLPQGVREAAGLYVGCVAGALPEPEYLALIDAAGFRGVRKAKEQAIVLPGEALSPHMSGDEIAAFRASGV